MAAISLFYDTNKGSFSKGVFERCTPTGNEVFFHFKAPRRYQICISKCLYYYRDDLYKTLGKTTVQKTKKDHFRLTCVAQKKLTYMADVMSCDSAP